MQFDTVLKLIGNSPSLEGRKTFQECKTLCYALRHDCGKLLKCTKIKKTFKFNTQQSYKTALKIWGTWKRSKVTHTHWWHSLKPHLSWSNPGPKLEGRSLGSIPQPRLKKPKQYLSCNNKGLLPLHFWPILMERTWTLHRGRTRAGTWFKTRTILSWVTALSGPGPNCTYWWSIMR